MELERFRTFIREKREALGFSIPDLSEKVFGDRKNTYIREIENGRRKGITVDMMERILQSLNSEICYNEL